MRQEVKSEDEASREGDERGQKVLKMGKKTKLCEIKHNDVVLEKEGDMGVMQRIGDMQEETIFTLR